MIFKKYVSDTTIFYFLVEKNRKKILQFKKYKLQLLYEKILAAEVKNEKAGSCNY